MANLYHNIRAPHKRNRCCSREERLPISQRQALFVLDKTGEILAWEKAKERERGGTVRRLGTISLRG